MIAFETSSRVYLGTARVVMQRGGEEEDELAAGDGRLEGIGVVHVRLEQHQPLHRAGELLQWRCLLLISYQIT